MSASDKRLADALCYADDRVRKHEMNEARRMRYGLKTDMDRWMETGEAWD